MDQIYKDLALISKAAKLAKYQVLGFTKSTDTGGIKIIHCAVLIWLGGDTCHSWNPITNEKDLFGWIKDIGGCPFTNGFIAPIEPPFTADLPEGYEPQLDGVIDKQVWARRLVAGYLELREEFPQR